MGFGINTPMKTWSGEIIPIQDLELGMSLIHPSMGSISEDYTTPTVISSISKKETDLLRLQFWNGKSIDLTYDHILCLTDNQNNHVEKSYSDIFFKERTNFNKYAFYRTYKHWDRNLIEHIIDVVFLGVGETYFIELDGEPTFYSEDYLILHC